MFHYPTFIFDKTINLLLTPSLEQPLSSPTLAVVTIHWRPVKISAEAKMLRGAAYLTDSPETAKRGVCWIFFFFLLSQSWKPKKRDVGYGQSSVEDRMHS